MLAHRSYRIALPMFSMGLAWLAVSLVTYSHAQPIAKGSVAKGTVATNPIAKESVAAPSADRIAKFETALTGVALVGHSTVTGNDSTKLEPERYELQSVKHVAEDRWLFTARITYGEHDVTVPLTLPVRWAGDTPVITVDNMGIPGLGTYTARVMIYSNHYSGFWSGGDHGGHLFGEIKPLEK